MPLAEFFQTTATINTGNSGGPLFNMAGEVVGIVSQTISQSGGSEGLGFVVTIDSARLLLVPRKVFWGALQGLLLSLTPDVSSGVKDALGQFGKQFAKKTQTRSN
jgi:hypothetical protein